MAVITCGLEEILNPDTCNDRGGIFEIYWTEYNNIDWATMLADPLQFDPTNQQILDYEMVGGATFNRLTFQRKEAYYEFTYTGEQDFYQILVTMALKGKDRDRRNKLMSAIQCCNVYLHIYENNGGQRAVGVDYNGEVFRDLLDTLHISRHLDAGGQLGTSKGRDEVDFGGEAFFAPLFANVPVANIPLV